MKGHKGYHHTHGTAEKINKHIAKHRASGGGVESPMKGKDEADEDLKSKPARYNEGKPENEAEAMHAKKGGKCVGKARGGAAHHPMGRKKRASGGAAENQPFTTARKGTPAKGRMLEHMTEGSDEE